MIDAYASHAHLVDHLAPIWLALPERGTFWVAARRLRPYAEALGIEPTFGHPLEPGGPILVANHQDYQHCHPSRPVVYLEHGAGQCYRLDDGTTDHPSYSGGKDRDRVALFLTLNEHTAERERRLYGHDRVTIIGSPRLDQLCAETSYQPGAHRPTVGFTWHWDAHLVPETRWAWPHYRTEVARLAHTGRWTILGHAHPRAMARMRGWYEDLGIEAVSFPQLCARADVLAVDNSSAAPEFAAVTRRPLVWLNGPHYRRDVHHGGRFWNWPHGQVSVDDPAELEGALVEALCDLPGAQASREWMVDHIYPPWTRGRSTALAVGAIQKMVAG